MGHTTSTYSKALLLEQQLSDTIIYNTESPDTILSLLTDYSNLQYNTEQCIDYNSYIFYNHSYTLLHLSVLSNLPLTKLLLTKYNVDINTQCRTPLHTHTLSELQNNYYIYKSRNDTLECDTEPFNTTELAKLPYYDYCDLKASIKYIDVSYTALMLCIIFCHTNTVIQMLELLLLYNADIYSSTSNIGYNVLMLACKRANPTVIDMLLDAGALLHSENNFGFTAIDVAHEHSNTAIYVLEKVLNDRQHKVDIVCNNLRQLPDTVIAIVLSYTSQERG